MIEPNIDLATFRKNLRNLLHWNLDPLSTAEILKSGDALHCPECKKLRYVMFKTATTETPLLYFGDYCVCPSQEDVQEYEQALALVRDFPPIREMAEVADDPNAGILTHEKMTTFLDDLKSGRVG
jgi:hypothetical protein